MKYFLVLGLFILTVQQSFAPPVKDVPEENEPFNDPMNQLEYSRYAREIIEVLENDVAFREKISNASQEDIASGKIASEIEYLNHHVRTKLDEIKRKEVSRLKEAVREMNSLNQRDKINIPNHLDHTNLHTFEKDDLKKLIVQLHRDLEVYDKERKKHFKEYEMEKKFDQELKKQGNTGLGEEERKKYEKELQEQEAKHKDHETLHHPGSKQQLEEVWEKEDHMDKDDFNPKVFFQMHDLDGNGYWDPEEINALFTKELDKLYNSENPEDDIVERIEEMERMREHFLNEADINKDSLLSFDEYYRMTQNPNFDKDEGWETIDQQKTFTQEEYLEFERKRQEEMRRTHGNATTPAPPPTNAPPQQYPPQYGQVPHPGMQQQVPYHGQPYQQMPQHQMPQYQQMPQHQMPQYQQVPQYQQMPQQHMPQQQMPQQFGQVPGQVPHVAGQQQYQQTQQHYQPSQPQFQPSQQQYQPTQQQYQPSQQQYQPSQQQYQPNPQYQGQVNQQQQGQVNQQPIQGQQQQQVNQQPPQNQVNQQGQVNQQQQQQQQQQQNQQVPGNPQQVQQNPPVAQGTINSPNSIPDVKKV